MIENTFRKRIFNIRNSMEFDDIALEVFAYQYKNNEVYRRYVDFLGIRQSDIHSPAKIPFLPVEFFRNNRVITGKASEEIVFSSSSTTGMVPGKHYVTDLSLYEESFLRSFRLFYGDPHEYLIAALLPSYTEREGSSLVYMANELIKLSGCEQSGYYRDEPGRLISVLQENASTGKKCLLLGVSFALLDLAEHFSCDLSGVTVMETGGMKGRRKEITREELHGILKQSLNIETVHSEYGMTELLSQAYSAGEGIFNCPPWMKIFTRDPLDPLTVINEPGQTGGINIIDLANINSCSFISTADLGKIHPGGSFEVLGRFDNSDIRGCNLLAD